MCGVPFPFARCMTLPPSELNDLTAALSFGICGLWAVGCGLWAVGCGLWAVGCGLWAVGVLVVVVVGRLRVGAEYPGPSL